MKYRLLSVRGSDGGVLKRSRLLPFVVGADRVDITGGELQSTVEAIENAGDVGAPWVAGSSTMMPPRATAAGRDENVGEDSLEMVTRNN